jgi:uncharacterized protein with PIN domain
VESPLVRRSIISYMIDTEDEGVSIFHPSGVIKLSRCPHCKKDIGKPISRNTKKLHNESLTRVYCRSCKKEFTNELYRIMSNLVDELSRRTKEMDPHG